MPSRRTFVFIATGWGSIKGGINSLNRDLCIAIAAEGIQVVCVVENADEIARCDAEASRVVLISSESELADLVDVNGLCELIRREGFPQVAWWIGHDAITGNVAIGLARSAGGRVAILHHMHRRSFRWLEGANSAKLHDLDKAQRAIFQKADLVVAVGPSLLESAADLLQDSSSKPPIVEIVPGLAQIELIDGTNKFNALIMGRFDEAARTKQFELAIAAFGRAAKDLSGPLGSQPILTVYGVDGKNEKGVQQRVKMRLKEQTDRLVQVELRAYETDRKALFSQVAQMSAVMMLSWYEAFGLVAWEAIAAGVPLVVSRTTGAYQQLLKMFGAEEVDQLVEAIEVKATADVSEAVNSDDVERVAQALKRIAQDPDGARMRVRTLRQRLLDAGITWEAAARKMIEACDNIDASKPANDPPVEQQDFVCAYWDASEQGGKAVALCLVVDTPDKVRSDFGEAMGRIARTKGIPQEIADRLTTRGFEPSIDSPQVRDAVISFIQTAPLRAYAIVVKSESSANKSQIRQKLFGNLIRERFKKRDLPLRGVRGASSWIADLKNITNAEWIASRPSQAVPNVAAEPRTSSSLLGIAELMAQVLALAVVAPDATFHRLRIKFAHIYDNDDKRNFTSEDVYP